MTRIYYAKAGAGWIEPIGIFSKVYLNQFDVHH